MLLLRVSLRIVGHAVYQVMVLNVLSVDRIVRENYFVGFCERAQNGAALGILVQYRAQPPEVG